MDAVTAQVNSVVSLLMSELERYQEAKHKIREISLTNKQASSIIGISTGYFANVKGELMDKGWFLDGISYFEAIELLEWRKKYGTLRNVPKKNIK
jgi:hypothetical protein